MCGCRRARRIGCAEQQTPPLLTVFNASAPASEGSYGRD
jgi:hypothetical protein